MRKNECHGMKSVFTLIAVAAWCVLVVVWIVGYVARARTPGMPHARSHLTVLVPAACLLVVCFALLLNAHSPNMRMLVTSPGVLLGSLGDALVLAGLGFAIWARVVLGHNWSGLVMMVRDGHQLVQDGPYAIVRHPIYTGLLAAILGTALTLGTLASWIAVASGLAGILLRVDVEERLMASEFGDAHAAYREKTRKLIPFVW
jgi:protein-S-isoprenylcysteine O-methyltransferase Ste14